jgi:hypothetical protein
VTAPSRPLWVSERLRTDPASLPTEVKREALIEYQTLFDDLLTAPGAVVPRGIKESRSTSWSSPSNTPWTGAAPHPRGAAPLRTTALAGAQSPSGLRQPQAIIVYLVVRR